MSKAKITVHRGTGKRKEASARVQLMDGTGKITINGRAFDHYFGRATDRMKVEQPLVHCGLMGKFDIAVNVGGSGTSGQAGAVRHGISRALIRYDETLRPKLKKEGFLTRDPRMVERKKYGKSGARKRYQYSKR